MSRMPADTESEVIREYLAESERLRAEGSHWPFAKVLYELAGCYPDQPEPRWVEAITCYREAAELLQGPEHDPAS